MSFAERDEMARRKRWEEMTGRKWPEDGSTPTGYVVDAQEAIGGSAELLQIGGAA